MEHQESKVSVARETGKEEIEVGMVREWEETKKSEKMTHNSNRSLLCVVFFPSSRSRSLLSPSFCRFVVLIEQSSPFSLAPHRFRELFSSVAQRGGAREKERRLVGFGSVAQAKLRPVLMGGKRSGSTKRARGRVTPKSTWRGPATGKAKQKAGHISTLRESANSKEK